MLLLTYLLTARTAMWTTVV